MKRVSREAYSGAVAAALAAIEEAKGPPRIRADRSPQAMLAKMQAKHAKGEGPTDGDMAALAAAFARGRGRPIGTRNHAARLALLAAAFAVRGIEMNAYRNGAAGHRLTQCDAIADAMVAAGFRSLATYDAVAREMRRFRHEIPKLIEAFGMLARRLEQMSRDLAEPAAAIACMIREVTTIPHEVQATLEKCIKTKL